jgi:hypothetical protein
LPTHPLSPFADDLILCGHSSVDEATTIKTNFDQFSLPLDRIPNFQKYSILFSNNVDDQTKSHIKHILLVSDLLPNIVHLGHPMIFNHRDRNKAYEFIINKFRAKLTTVKANKLNHSRRLTYIKSVLASIPVYYMSISSLL